MAKSLNRAQLIGNAGKDAEVRYTGTGKPVATFSLATSSSWKDKTTDQWQEKTEWHNIVAWDRLAEVCGEYVKKGKRVFVEGRIQTRSYDDKDGNKRYITEINASDLILLDGPRDGEGGAARSNDYAPRQSSYQQGGGSDFESSSVPEDDLPF